MSWSYWASALPTCATTGAARRARRPSAYWPPSVTAPATRSVRHVRSDESDLGRRLSDPDNSVYGCVTRCEAVGPRTRRCQPRQSDAVRTLLRIKIDTEFTNAATQDGDGQRAFTEPTATIHPEAARLLPTDEQRSAMFVFDMQDSSTIPSIVEPLFKTLNASVELSPVMNLDDFATGLSSFRS